MAEGRNKGERGGSKGEGGGIEGDGVGWVSGDVVGGEAERL